MRAQQAMSLAAASVLMLGSCIVRARERLLRRAHRVALVVSRVGTVAEAEFGARADGGARA